MNLIMRKIFLKFYVEMVGKDFSRSCLDSSWRSTCDTTKDNDDEGDEEGDVGGKR